MQHAHQVQILGHNPLSPWLKGTIRELRVFNLIPLWGLTDYHRQFREVWCHTSGRGITHLLWANPITSVLLHAIILRRGWLDLSPINNNRLGEKGLLLEKLMGALLWMMQTHTLQNESDGKFCGLVLSDVWNYPSIHLFPFPDMLVPQFSSCGLNPGLLPPSSK
jgi:hypothetical protein